MKILYITLENLSFQKGSVVHIREVVDGFRKLGHQVGLIARSENKFEKADHFYNLQKQPFFFFFVRLIGMKKQPYVVSSLLLFFYIFKTLSEYDVIYARDYHTVIIASLPRVFFKKKLVFEVNGLAHEEQRLKRDNFFNRMFSFFIKKAEKMATRYSDRIISVTPQMAFYLKDQFDCSPEKIEVISNGVNINLFYPIGDGDTLLHWRKRHGITQGEIVVAFVGNLAPWQGIEDLVRVAPLLLGKINNIKFLIIGDGILRKDFEAEVKRLQLSNYFLFTGMVNHHEIPLYINIADVCVVLKRRLISGYSPIKLYEYMACGKPIVATRVEGLEFVEAEGIGRLIEPGDIVNLGKILLDLLGNNQKRIAMGQKCREIAQEKFSWDSRVIKIENILKGLA